MIEVKNLNKNYKIHEGRSGLKGSIVDLFKREYKVKEAVKDVSFSIQKEEIVGYIGMNGAGKSTTIKILTGIMAPTSGQVKVNGLVPFHNRRQHAYNIGVVFGQRSQLWWDLAVGESFELLRNMYDVPKDLFDTNMKWINEVLNFEILLRQQVRKLSLGQRMLCDIVAAFIHNPEVIFLDEPTIGLDIMVKEQVHTFIRETNKRFGTTFIITTHDINDIEKLCNRILIIDKGQLIFNGKLEEIFKQYGNQNKMIFESQFQFLDRKVSDLLPTDLNWEINDKTLKVTYDQTTISSKSLIDKIFANFDTIKDVSIEKSSLEYIVKKIYEARA
ncbi:MAG: ATP-binding cassette domain-containing protein [Halanaerobiales bacterium]|nr:ATP-binding cassette domain-containing protein [Halanaerobiales bacterium]